MLRTRTFQSLSASDDIKVLYDKISKLEPVVITHALSGTSFPKDGDVINITESKYNQLVSAFDNFNPVIIKTQCSSIRCYAVPYASEEGGNTYSVYNYKMFLDIPKINSTVMEEDSFGRYSYIDIPLKSKIKEDRTYDLVYRINKNDLSIYDYNIEGISIDQLKPNTVIQDYNQNYYTKVKECVELGGRLYLYYNDTVINKLKVTHLNTARSSTDKNNYIEYIVCDLRRDTLTLDEDLLIVFVLGYSTNSEGVSTSEYMVSIMSNNINRSDVERALVGNVSSHNHDSMYLNKTNTSNFTPTSDYHPATKKYVDDKVSRSTSITKSQVESVLTGTITSHDHDSRYLSKTNTSSFTPTSDYHPATKKYVDNQSIILIGNLLGLNLGENIDITDKLINLDKIYENCICYLSIFTITNDSMQSIVHDKNMICMARKVYYGNSAPRDYNYHLTDTYIGILSRSIYKVDLEIKINSSKDTATFTSSYNEISLS